LVSFINIAFIYGGRIENLFYIYVRSLCIYCLIRSFYWRMTLYFIWFIRTSYLLSRFLEDLILTTFNGSIAGNKNLSRLSFVITASRRKSSYYGFRVVIEIKKWRFKDIFEVSSLFGYRFSHLRSLWWIFTGTLSLRRFLL